MFETNPFSTRTISLKYTRLQQYIKLLLFLFFLFNQHLYKLYQHKTQYDANDVNGNSPICSYWPNCRRSCWFCQGRIHRDPGSCASPPTNRPPVSDSAGVAVAARWGVSTCIPRSQVAACTRSRRRQCRPIGTAAATAPSWTIITSRDKSDGTTERRGDVGARGLSPLLT